jgi:hypothetical protein
MNYNPLLVVCALLGVAGLLAIPAIGEPLGVRADRSMQIAVIHAELAACVLLLLPRRGGSRGAVALNLAATLACFAAASACVLLLSFLDPGELPWQTRAGAFGAWMFAGGVLALGARLGSPWPSRGRILLLCLYGLPVLAHYIALEYAGASLLHLRPLSPSWALAAGELSWLPLLPLSLLPWAGAFALPQRREET